MNQRGIKMPADKNPVVKVGRYKERAPEIRFLTLTQIDRQLNALAGATQLQAMVATLIYAGLRREELLWLNATCPRFATSDHPQFELWQRSMC